MMKKVKGHHPMRWMMALVTLSYPENSSAAILRCKHQARNGHAKGEKTHSHPAGNSANDDCSISHFRRDLL